jgi:tetratricopeptide (TPR) repeat protein
LTHFSAGDQQRLWGLAELEWAEKQTQPEARRRIQQQAETHLQAAVAAGLADTAVHVALARLAWERQDLGRAREFSERALNGVPRPQRHVDALFILGDCYLQHGRPDLALPFFEQLVTLRRASLDWSLLGYCQQQQGNPQAAWDAFRRAASIAPAESDLLETLIGLSRERQDAAAEATYTQRLRMLPSSTLPGSSARKSK